MTTRWRRTVWELYNSKGENPIRISPRLVSRGGFQSVHFPVCTSFSPLPSDAVFFIVCTSTTDSLQSCLLLKSPNCTTASLVYSLRFQHSPFWRICSAFFFILSPPYSHQPKMFCYENVSILFQTTPSPLYTRRGLISFNNSLYCEPVSLQLLRETMR